MIDKLLDAEPLNVLPLLGLSALVGLAAALVVINTILFGF